MHLSRALLLAASFVSLAAAHGYLSSPPPRGIQKATYDVDDLKSPNKKGLCRGEPQGQITQVSPGQSITLGLTITAPHVGPCTVYLLDGNLQNQRQIATKSDCAAPGKVGPWTITLPNDISGHNVIRWFWEAEHVTPHEMYEQCIDIMAGGSGQGSSGNDDDDESHGIGQGHYSNDNGANAPVSSPPTFGQTTPSAPPPVPAPVTPLPAPDDSNLPSTPTTPANPSNPPYVPPTSDSNGGSCTSGAFQCTSDGGFNQCANGSWTKMACAPGTSCQQSSSSIVCALSGSSQS